MWIFLWIVLSLFILGVFGWSVLILRQQKTAWAAFAIKNNLVYAPNKFMEAAMVRGPYGGYLLSLFADRQQTTDVRGERFVSVIEFELGGGMKTGAVIGTKEMKGFIDGLSFNETYRPEHEKWSDDYIVRTRNQAALKDYLTPARVEALLRLFSMNRVSALFFFDEQDCVVHLETIDPLRNAEKLDRIVARILNDVRKLALPDMGQKKLAPPAGQSQAGTKMEQTPVAAPASEPELELELEPESEALPQIEPEPGPTEGLV